MNKIHPSTLRSALWTWRSMRLVRSRLKRGGFDVGRLPRVPRVADRAVRGVNAVLRRAGATCLERSSILQVWEAAHGRRRDIVVGVTAPSQGFQAHAWLDGDAPCHDHGFHEMLRRPAPA